MPTWKDAPDEPGLWLRVIDGQSSVSGHRVDFRDCNADCWASNGPYRTGCRYACTPPIGIRMAGRLVQFVTHLWRTTPKPWLRYGTTTLGERGT